MRQGALVATHFVRHLFFMFSLSCIFKNLISRQTVNQ
jgi:hypothetical protein